ncbi:hypothetical protein [Tatumella sp. OPLPL6]|uniref:hypothetical protein n=1 Tax=Tatumella sp. OPLPL6 TaxID=1928657 RepID=UPI000C1844AE|nr:hypothetical protein [Tatumella sp. OPLPL6]PIJ43291.1 hypothetical protein BOM24_08975 [Tatumella sp. OPLPL6]
MKNRFYLSCQRDNVGGNMAFHGQNGQGYHTNIDKAHVYTREEAQRAWELGRDFDVPISADHVDALTIWRVDHQYIPYENLLVDGCDQYVAFVKGSWNGNDVYWLTEYRTSDDFSKVKVFSQPDLSDKELVWMPYSVANEQKRRTFDVSNYSPKRMTQGAGIKMPGHVKRAKNRKKNPLCRINCPDCGRINWQEHDYHFEGCRNVDCEARRF